MILLEEFLLELLGSLINVLDHAEALAFQAQVCRLSLLRIRLRIRKVFRGKFLVLPFWSSPSYLVLLIERNAHFGSIFPSCNFH